MLVHSSDFSSHDVVISPLLFPGWSQGSFVLVQLLSKGPAQKAAGEPPSQVILQLTSTDPVKSSSLQVSVSLAVAETLGLRGKRAGSTPVEVRLLEGAAEAAKEFGLSHVEVSLR